MKCPICLATFYGAELLLHEGNLMTANNKIVGEIVREQSLYITRRNPDEHYYRKGKGYPISTDILDRLSGMGIKDILILEDDIPNRVHNRYFMHVADYMSEPVFQELNYDPQRCAPLIEAEKI
jgi:hypothetical protein